MFIFFSTLFLKIFFDSKKIYFFDGIFFKVYLLLQEKRFEAVSERSRQFKTRKSHAEEIVYLSFQMRYFTLPADHKQKNGAGKT